MRLFSVILAATAMFIAPSHASDDAVKKFCATKHFSESTLSPSLPDDCGATNNTANEAIGCAKQDVLIQMDMLLAKRCEKLLQTIIVDCEKKHTGGGSGGFADRVQCMSETVSTIK